MNRFSQKWYRLEFKLKSWVMNAPRDRMQRHQKTLMDFVKDHPPSHGQRSKNPRFQEIVARVSSPEAIKKRMVEWCEKEGSELHGMRRWKS